MKTIIILSLVTLMAGCALFKAQATANVVSPTVYVDGKAIEVGQKVVGDFTANTKNNAVYLKTFNFWSFIGGFGIWFFIGGAFMLAGVVSAIWFKAFKIALASIASGSTILLSAFFLKLFWVYLAWITAILAALVVALVVIRYRKTIIREAKEIATGENTK